MAKKKQPQGEATSSKTPENTQGQHRRTIEERLDWLRAHGCTITNDSDDSETLVIVGVQRPPDSGGKADWEQRLRTTGSSQRI